MQSNIDYNKFAHDKISMTYDQDHTEIYNEIEQERLSMLIWKIVKMSWKPNPIVLDFWSWTWNLSAHFINSWARVVAADISQNSLDIITYKFWNSVETQLINWTDLNEIQDGTFDIIWIYSVLHHIPNYLLAIEECMRCLRQWWLLYIDHEHNESYRNRSDLFWALKNSKESRGPFKIIVDTLSSPKKVIKKCYIYIMRLFDAKFQYEWDIHVWKDDHIDWNLIHSTILKQWWKILEDSQYLLYRWGYNIDLYNILKDSIADMQYVVAQKL